MYDVTKISYTPGDILIFAVDMDTYDIEECRSIYDAILKQAPAYADSCPHRTSQHRT